ncbi:MAG: hypothetical protein AAF702_47215 [Chloroflexota bacterium]
MENKSGLALWEAIVVNKMPSLSKPEAVLLPLVTWVLSWWSSDEKRLALATDASSLGKRFVVLAISIVYRGCAIPVAWIVPEFG